MTRFLSLLAILILTASVPAFAEGEPEETDTGDLVNKLNNPVASLITIPIEYNRDRDIGPDESGERISLKFSPVIPFEVGEDWNVISRTIFSYVHQELPAVGVNEDGINDIAATFFLSPRVLGESGIVWGVGPLFLLNSATQDSLGTGRWGVGPSAVVLKQTGPWTIGALGHYLPDVGGDKGRDKITQVFLQPFLSYNLPDNLTSLTLQSEITHLFDTEDTGAFLLFQANRLFRVGSQLLQGRVGVRQWVERQGFGPQGTEFNARLTFLFPK